MTQDRQTELDTDEQRIATLYRSLPAGEPSPALDARIRAQAHAAVRTKRPQRPTWLWGAGVAASAVLAVGMFWRMGLPEMQQRGPKVSSQMASEPARDDTAVLDSAEMASPQIPPEPSRAGAAEPASTASMMNEQDEALDAAKPASPSGQLSANQAARERAAAPAMVRSAPAEKQEAFADGRAVAGNETIAGAAASEAPRQKRAEVETSLGASTEREAIADTSPASGNRHSEDAAERAIANGWISEEELPHKQLPGDPPPLIFDEPAPMAVEAPPPAPPAPPPPPVVFDEPSEMAVEMPPPAPPAPTAPPVELPAQAAPVAAAPKVILPRKEVGERDAERRQLGKMKDDDLDTIDVSGNNISPIDVSSVETTDVLVETSTKDIDAIANAIAELPRRFRRDVAKNAKLYPESWLARIEALLATDKRDEAVANLRVFRVAYPDQALPEALATLAREEGLDSGDIDSGEPQP